MAYETAMLKQLKAYTAKHLSRMGGVSPHIRLTDYNYSAINDFKTLLSHRRDRFLSFDVTNVIITASPPSMGSLPLFA